MCPSECSEWGLNWWSVVKTSLSSEGGSGSIPCWEAKIPHASWPKSQNAELKQHCNKSNTDFLKKKNVLSGLYDLTLLTCQIHPPPSCPGSIWPPPCPGSILSWVRGLSAGERVFRHVWSWRPSAAADQQDIPRRGIFKQTSRSTTKSMSFRVRWLRFKIWFCHFG